MWLKEQPSTAPKQARSREPVAAGDRKMRKQAAQCDPHGRSETDHPVAPIDQHRAA